MLFQGMARDAEPKIPGKPVDASFLVIEGSADTLEYIPFIAGSESLPFKKLRGRVATRPEETYWVRLDFQGWEKELSSRPLWILQTGVFNEAEAYLQQLEFFYSKAFGSFQQPRSPGSHMFTDRIEFDPSHLIGGRYLILRLRKLTGRGYIDPGAFRVYDQQANQLAMAREALERQQKAAGTYLFLGLAIPMLLFTLVVYLQNRQKDFLLYAGYLLFLILFFGRTKIPGYLNLVGNDSFVSFFGSNLFEILSSIFYTGFTIEYLKTRTHYPLFHKFLWGIIGFLAVLLLADSSLLLAREFRYHELLLNLRALVLSAFVLLAIAYLYTRGKSRLAYFIATGSACYSLGSIGLFATGDPNYLLLGVILEIMVFGYGLAYKIYHVQREKQRLEKEASDQKMSALRAQMNPHFIFNSLTAIQHLITRNDRLGALKYLNKFSVLMRRTLEHSVTANISLAEEIRFLKHYLEIEHLRFEGAFSYEVTVSEDLDPEATEVPLLLVQPFVENAIIHGLMPKLSGARELQVAFSTDQGLLKCEVTDNGIGREASRNRQRGFGKRHVSRGMEVTQQRLQMLPGPTAAPGQMEITDLKDPEGIPRGTRVTLWIPLQ